MRSNGFLVLGLPKNYNGINYHGVDNNPFPIDEKEFSTFLDCEQSELLYNILFFPENGVSLLDENVAELYYSYCVTKKMKVCLMYAELEEYSENIDPILKNVYNVEKNFIGYDVADCAYDFYSALLMDVIMRPELLQENFKTKLNSNGLFSSIDDAKCFLDEREKSKKDYDEMTFEGGKYQIISLFKVHIDRETGDGSVSGRQINKNDKE